MTASYAEQRHQAIAVLVRQHGGIFAISGVLGFLAALVAGTLVGGAAVLLAKQLGRTPASAA